MLVLGTAFTADAQERAIRAGGDFLTIGAHRDEFSQPDFHAYCIEYDWRPAEDSFASAYGYPSFGVGVVYNTLSRVTFFSDSGHFDDMVAAYGKVSRDLLRWERLSIGYDASLGLSYSPGCYDVITNSANWSMGAPVLFYVAGGGHVTWSVTPRIDVEAEMGARHNSSARLAYPNEGLNCWSGGLSARYYLQPVTKPEKRKVAIPETEYEKGWHYELYAGGGVHTCAAEWLALILSEDKETLDASQLRRWPMASLSFDAIYRMNGKLALGATADAFYASNSEVLRWADGIIYGEESSRGYAPFSGGIGVVQEVFYKHIALYMQECVYLYRKTGTRGYHGPVYERVGFRLYPPWLDPVFMSVCIKAHAFKADYLDFTVGIKL